MMNQTTRTSSTCTIDEDDDIIDIEVAANNAVAGGESVVETTATKTKMATNQQQQGKIHDEDNDDSLSLSYKEDSSFLDDLTPPQSKGEQIRDNIIDMLDTRIFQYLGLLVLFCIIVDGAFFFFLLVGWHSMCDLSSDEESSETTSTNNNNDDDDEECSIRNWYLNMSIQFLNICFTYTSTISMPWRCTNFLHLVGWSCPYRSNNVGVDLYGLPTTTEIWFHIPSRARLFIIIQLLGNCLAQYINQITRIIFWTYQESSYSQAAIIWTNLFFGLSFLLGITGGMALFYYDHKTRQSSVPPNRFGPGPIDIIKNYLFCGSDKQEMEQEHEDCNNKEEERTTVFENPRSSCSLQNSPQEQIEVPMGGEAAVARGRGGEEELVDMGVDSEYEDNNEVTQTHHQAAATHVVGTTKMNVTPFDRNEMRLFAM